MQNVVYMLLDATVRVGCVNFFAQAKNHPRYKNRACNKVT